MITRNELLDWVTALSEDAMIGIDEGGLSLVVHDSGAGRTEHGEYFEIGGIPEDEPEDDEPDGPLEDYDLMAKDGDI
jgi:hypothetical protein